MTNRKGYLQSLYQGLGQTLSFFMRQVPPDLAPQIDLDLVRQAISITDEGGARIFPEVWDHRPDSQAALTKRKNAEQEWQSWSRSQRRFIPSLAHRERPVTDINEEGSKGKRHCINKGVETLITPRSIDTTKRKRTLQESVSAGPRNKKAKSSISSKKKGTGKSKKAAQKGKGGIGKGKSVKFGAKSPSMR